MSTKGRFTGSLHLAKYSLVFDRGHDGYMSLAELPFDLSEKLLWQADGGNMLLDKMNAFV